jgi:hypothetical protein
MALYRLICAFGQQSLVSVLLKCHLPLPAYLLADEKHSNCLTDRVYLPTIVSGRVIWHLGSSASKSAVAFTESYGEFQRATLEHEPSYRVQGALIDGFDRTTKSMRTLFPGARLGYGLRHALNKIPDKLVGLAVPVRNGLRSTFSLSVTPLSPAQELTGGGAWAEIAPFRGSRYGDGRRRARRAGPALVRG